jgi:hypothetical protein
MIVFMMNFVIDIERLYLMYSSMSPVEKEVLHKENQIGL